LGFWKESWTVLILSGSKCSSEETFWTEFLRKLRRRGLRAVKMEISDAHEGLKAVVAKLMNATWQRSRVQTVRNPSLMPGRVAGASSRRSWRIAFAQDSGEAARSSGDKAKLGGSVPDRSRKSTHRSCERSSGGDALELETYITRKASAPRP
jgi:hypothetical protein